MAGKSFLIGCLLAVFVDISLAVLSMKPISTIHIPYDIVPAQGRTRNLYGLNQGAAEKSAYDADTMVAYTAGRRYLHIVNFTDVFSPKIESSYRLTAPVLDIAECGNLVAFTSRDRVHVTNPGMIHIYTKTPVFDSLCNLTVGSNPKSLRFNPACDTIVVANEGPAAENPETETFVNPEGTISVVRVNHTWVNPSISQCQSPLLMYGSDVRTIDFTLFNNPQFAADLESRLIRHPYKGQMDGGEHTFSMNVEPEYVTIDPYLPIAYVTLQENNAIAEINYENLTAIIHPVGVKNWTNYDIDASSLDAQSGERRALTYRRYPIESLLQPDAVELFDANGEIFLVTANEGAPINYMCESCEIETEYFEYEEAQELAADYLLSQNVPTPVRQAMLNPRQLGQLRISMVDGLPEPGAEKIDRPLFYGGRGISLFRVGPYSMDLVWDSGDQISKGITELYPNAHNHPPFGNPELVEGAVRKADLVNRRWDAWSPFTGPECQSLAVGRYNASHKVIIVGINGANALGLFTVPLSGNSSDPNFESVYRDGEIRAIRRMTYNQLYQSDLQKLQRIDARGIGDLDPDSIVYIPPEKTVGQQPLVMVTSRVSGTITLYRIYEIPRHQLLLQKTPLDGGATGTTPSTFVSLLIACIATLFVALRH
ncbi:mesenchyme-specific cell surface glycoprotein-like [Diadema antillarum]|uniref:mesenchyme-specific cell surface glycoprotein-like n=1 Tax=Diadema antillarum TaxID=105358 RepID=UPI003A8B85D0